MSQSNTTPGDGEPFDVEQFARDTTASYQMAEDDAELLEDRVMRLEEIVAARWPRRWLLRRRLAREIRASVGAYDDSFIPRGDFHGRRGQWACEEASARRRDLERLQEARRRQDGGRS